MSARLPNSLTGPLSPAERMHAAGHAARGCGIRILILTGFLAASMVAFPADRLSFEGIVTSLVLAPLAMLEGFVALGLSPGFATWTGGFAMGLYPVLVVSATSNATLRVVVPCAIIFILLLIIHASGFHHLAESFTADFAP